MRVMPSMRPHRWQHRRRERAPRRDSAVFSPPPAHPCSPQVSCSAVAKLSERREWRSCPTRTCCPEQRPTGRNSTRGVPRPRPARAPARPGRPPPGAGRRSRRRAGSAARTSGRRCARRSGSRRRSAAGAGRAGLHLELEVVLAGIALEQLAQLGDDVASRRAASTRRRSRFGTSSAARSAAVALAFSISASEGSKRVDVLDDDADLVGVLVVHAAAHEHDLVGGQRRPRPRPAPSRRPRPRPCPRGRRPSRTSSSSRCGCGSSWPR